MLHSELISEYPCDGELYQSKNSQLQYCARCGVRAVEPKSRTCRIASGCIACRQA